MYTEKVLDHFQHPRNVGELEGANGVGMVGNAKCGDIMQMRRGNCDIVNGNRNDKGQVS